MLMFDETIKPKLIKRLAPILSPKKPFTNCPNAYVRKNGPYKSHDCS